jgi:hypothetical protein
MDMEHIKVLFFHPSPPSVVVCNAPCHRNTPLATVYTCAVFQGLLYISVWADITETIHIYDGHAGAHNSTIDAMWTHIKVHLSVDNWNAHYIFCLAEYSFGGCVPFTPHWPLLHVHLHWEMCAVCSVGTVVTTDDRGGHSTLCTIILAFILTSLLSSHLLPPLAPPTNATLKALCLCRRFSCSGWPMLQ